MKRDWIVKAIVTISKDKIGNETFLKANYIFFINIISTKCLRFSFINITYVSKEKILEGT